MNIEQRWIFLKLKLYYPAFVIHYPTRYRTWLSDIQPDTGDFCLISSRLPEMAVLIPARYQRWLSDIRPDTGDGCLISGRIPEMAVWYPARCRRWLSDIRSGIGYPRNDRLFYNICQTTVYYKCYSNKGLFKIKNAAHFFKWWIKMPVFSHSKFHVCYVDTVFFNRIPCNYPFHNLGRKSWWGGGGQKVQT